MEPYGGGSGTGGQGPDTGLEESMWKLELGGGGGRGSGETRLPERPGEQDCTYYLRTGTCGFGERCRFNHPLNRSAATFGGGGRTNATTDHPERLGQPVCEYYMKTGTCKFGSSCKYHHPRQGVGMVRPVLLNNYGYPLRPGEKECLYYMKTGQCKFGSTCKFHHPELGDISMPLPRSAVYPTMQTSSIPSAQPYPPLASWQIGRPPVVPGSYGPYGPMVMSSGVIPMHGWNAYSAPVVSVGGQQTVQGGPVYGLSQQISPSTVAYTGPYVPLSSSVRPSNSNERERAFPERPGEPECQYYMKTGDCKFGSSCKYHHPRERNTPKSYSIPSPLGLPLRPGAQPCSYYAQHGFCNFGPTCKFDHPMGTLSYSPSASSLSDIPIAPYPLGFSMPTLAPSSPSSDLLPEYLLNKDPSANRAASINTTAAPVGSILSKGLLAPHNFIRPQSSTAGGGTITTHGGEL